MLLLLLSLLGSASGELFEKRTFSHFLVPEGGLPDGSQLTFYFEHGQFGGDISVRLNFYDLPVVKEYNNDTIVAHIRVDRTNKEPVVTNTYVEPNWTDETYYEQALKGPPPKKGWWRVDVLKMSNHEMSVCFQGFWSNIRSFEKRLNTIKSIFIISKDVKPISAKVQYAPPDKKLLPWLNKATFLKAIYSNWGAVTKPILYKRMPHFRENKRFFMSAFLRASAEAKQNHPEIIIATLKKKHIFKIKQVPDSTGTKPEFQIISIADNKKTLCNLDSRYNGDLRHMRFHRNQSLVNITLYYAPYLTGRESCAHPVPDLAQLNDGFLVYGDKTGLPLRVSYKDFINLKQVTHDTPLE